MSGSRCLSHVIPATGDGLTLKEMGPAEAVRVVYGGERDAAANTTEDELAASQKSSVWVVPAAAAGGGRNGILRVLKGSDWPSTRHASPPYLTKSMSPGDQPSHTQTDHFLFLPQEKEKKTPNVCAWRHIRPALNSRNRPSCHILDSLPFHGDEEGEKNRHGVGVSSRSVWQ